MAIRPTLPQPTPPAPTAPRAITTSTPRTVSSDRLTVAPGYSSESRFDPAPENGSTFKERFGQLVEAVKSGALRGADRVRENQALQALSPDQRAEYQQVQKALADDPQGQDALRQLLLDGKLTQPGADGKSALDSMARLADPNATTAIGGTTPKAVLAQTVRDLQNPGAMNQGENNTLCGPVSVMQQKAATDPAGYAAVVAGLTLDGQATIPHGDGNPVTLKVQDPFAVDGSRSPTEQIVGVALLNPGNGKYITDNRGVTTPSAAQERFLEENGAEGQPTFGSTAGDQAWMQYALLGGNYEGQKIPAGSSDAETAAKNTILDQTAKGKQVSVLLSPSDGSGLGHWVTVTQVDRASNQVTYVDGQGQQHTEDLDAFLNGTSTGADGQASHTAAESLTFDADAAGSNMPPSDLIDWRSDPGGGHRLSGSASSSSDQGGTTTTTTTSTGS